jgi:uncharacterized SAM-binding protein YcdF (DUF218 family)
VKLRRAAIAAIVVVAAVAIFHSAIFRALAGFLILASPPEHADIAVVLAGDSMGNRVLAGGDLVRQGYVPKALVDGPSGHYGFNESDLAIAFAKKAGYPETYFLPLPMEAHSTEEEARIVADKLRELRVHKVLLVTSTYHTRRCGLIFRRVDHDHQFVVISAPDRYFTVDGWWKNREGQKTFFMEWMKTFAAWLGI